MRTHISASIDGLLKKTDECLAEMFPLFSGYEVREILEENKQLGHRYIPAEGCDNFDPMRGCGGHEKSTKL